MNESENVINFDNNKDFEKKKTCKCQLCFSNINEKKSLSMCNNCKGLDYEICMKCYLQLKNDKCPFCNASSKDVFIQKNIEKLKKIKPREWMKIFGIKLAKCNHCLDQSNPNFGIKKCNNTQFPLLPYCIKHAKKYSDVNIENLEKIISYTFIFILSEKYRYNQINKNVYINKEFISTFFHIFVYVSIDLINKEYDFNLLKENYLNKIKKIKNNIQDSKMFKDLTDSIFLNFNKENGLIKYNRFFFNFNEKNLKYKNKNICKNICKNIDENNNENMDENMDENMNENMDENIC